MATYDELGIGVKLHGSREQKVKCPQCAHTRRNKADKSLSVNLDKGVYNCHNCSWKGVVDGQTEADKKRSWMESKKEYARPPQIELPLSDNTRAFFNKRGIEDSTLQYYGVSESVESMPDKSGKWVKRTCINFNYYRNREKINVKYRDGQKNFRMVKDAELILYNQDCLKSRTDMLICEGEIDCMSFYQSGYFGAVSVPNGASKGSARLEYLDNCAEVFEGMEKIIIATDGDEAGQYLKNELARRLGKHRCWFVEYPDGCKDANEVQLKHGIGAVRTLWETAVAPPLENIITVDDEHTHLQHIYENGWPDREPVGYDEFDSLLNFESGQFTIVTGVPQHGKDSFLRQLLVRKASRYGHRSGVFNFEEPAHIDITKIAQLYVGKPFYRKNPNGKMTPAELESALAFANEHFFFIDIAKADLSIDGILSKMRELVLRKGIKFVVIGPHNCIEHNRPASLSETEYIGQILQKVKRFAMQTNTHVFYVAHPTKVPKSKETGQYEVPTLYMIAGSHNFFSMTDNGMCIYRNADNTTDVYVQKVKFFYNGKTGFTSFKFDLDTARYQEPGIDFESEIKRFGTKQAQMFNECPPVPMYPPDESIQTGPEPVGKVRPFPKPELSDLSGWDGPKESVPF